MSRHAANWYLPNGLIAFFCYMGLVQGIEGFYRLAMFCAWLQILTSGWIYSEAVVTELRDRGRAVPAVVSVTYDIVLVSLFIYYDAILTGIGLVVSAIMIEGAYREHCDK